MRAERAKNLEERAVRLEEVVPQKARCALDLATEKGLSMSQTTLPLKELGFNLNKREFRDGLSQCYDWPIANIPFTCLCGEPFTKDHAIIGSCVIKISVGRHSRPICQPTVSRHVDQVSTDISVDISVGMLVSTRATPRPICCGGIGVLFIVLLLK